MKKSVVFAFMFSALLLTACSTAHHQSTAWETKTVLLTPSQADTELKKYAEDGWTCVGVITGSPVSPTGELRGYMLKRPKE
jgi:outer membrane biogenesis lipoprotein LolB